MTYMVRTLGRSALLVCMLIGWNGVALAQSTPSSIKLLSAQSISNTSVRLTFSYMFSVSQEEASSILHIADTTGTALPIRIIHPEGKTATLTTGPQVDGMKYTVTFSSGQTATFTGTIKAFADQNDSSSAASATANSHGAAPASRLPAAGMDSVVAITLGGGIAGWLVMKKMRRHAAV